MTTLVTAFFDINRHTQGDGRTIDEYLQWIHKTLQGLHFTERVNFGFTGSYKLLDKLQEQLLLDKYYYSII